MAKSDNQKWTIVAAIIIVMIAGLLIAVAFLLNSNAETRTSTTPEDVETKALICKAHSADGAFFAPQDVQANEHEIKVALKDNAVYRMAYSYEGIFASENAAEYANALLHGDYNKYMAEKGVYQEKLYPTFVTDQEKLKINLYADIANLNSATAGFFFLTPEDYSDLDFENGNELKKLYEKKGFKCDFNK